MAGELKIRGYGTLVKADFTVADTMVTCGYITATSPPERSAKTVDGTTLADNREQMDPGIGEASEFTFEQFWLHNETNSALIDTAHSNALTRTSRYNLTWHVIYPQATPVTEEFTGWVKKIGPAQIVNNEYSKRTITVQTTSTSVLS